MSVLVNLLVALAFASLAGRLSSNGVTISPLLRSIVAPLPRIASEKELPETTPMRNYESVTRCRSHHAEGPSDLSHSLSDSLIPIVVLKVLYDLPVHAHEDHCFSIVLLSITWARARCANLHMDIRQAAVQVDVS